MRWHLSLSVTIQVPQLLLRQLALFTFIGKSYWTIGTLRRNVLILKSVKFDGSHQAYPAVRERGVRLDVLATNLELRRLNAQCVGTYRFLANRLSI